MKKGIVFFLIFLVQLLAFNQTQLTNVYSSFSKVYGGTEDGGISGWERYVFLTDKKVVIDAIFFDNKEIVLTKKDSLVVIIETYTPYNSARPILSIDTGFVENIIIAKQPEWQTVARVSKKGNTYYVSVPYPNQWNGNVAYSYKGNYFSATKKSEFDTGNTGYAP